MEKVIRFNVKLNPDFEKSIIDILPGVVESIRLFPNETDEELLLVYVVDAEPAMASDILATLMDHPGIEYVELPKSRKIRS